MRTAGIKSNRNRRRSRIRARLSGSATRPRLCVFKSNTAVYAQLIDDGKAVTLFSATGRDAYKVGADIAKKALAKKIDRVVFDRSGYIYTGKILALAEGARQTGLKF